MQPAYAYGWYGTPFIRLLIPLVSGILIVNYFQPSLKSVMILMAVFLLLYFLLEKQSILKKFQWNWLSGVCLNVLLIAMGSLLILLHKFHKNQATFTVNETGSSYLAISIEEVLAQNSGSGTDRFVAAIRSEWEQGACRTVKGRCLLSVRKDSTDPNWEPGQILLIRKQPRLIHDNGNPGGFSYRQYYARQGIHYQLYLNKTEYRICTQTAQKGLHFYLHTIRRFVIQTIRKLIPGEKEQGLAEALLIGYRNDLDKELVKSYSRMGVVHIIAISGLHLGMIYGLLLLFSKPFQRLKWFRWVKPVILLSVLWFFTLLAGAAPSVLRSALMFSFIILGECFSKKIKTFHSLTASAFFLLMVNPYFLWDTGFQLSYAAVGGIVLLWKPVYKMIYVKNRLLRAFWQMQAITISAQVFTLPLTLYYFHQFPNLFLFTNALAVPLSGYVLYGELLILVFCKIPLLNNYTGQIVSWLIRCLNGFIERTDRLPFALTENIRFGLIETIFLYGILCFVILALLQRNNRCFLGSLLLVLFLFLYRTILSYHFRTQNKLVMYDISGREHIDIYQGKQVWVWGEDAPNPGDQLKNAILSTSRREHGIMPDSKKPAKRITHPLYLGQHRTVLHIDRYFQLMPVKKPLPVDLIILGPFQPFSITQIAAVFSGKQYIFAAGTPLWKIRYWKKEADSLHLRHHTVSEQGAFEMEL